MKEKEKCTGKGCLIGGRAGLQFLPRLTTLPLGIKKKEWSDYLQHYREQRRREALRRLPRDLRCPQCGLIKLKPRQWVRRGVCRVCNNENKKGKCKVDTNVFIRKEIIRYDVDGQKLRKLRQDLGLTLKVMAYRIGWTHSWQCRLEVGDVCDITPESYEKFQRFISKLS